MLTFIFEKVTHASSPRKNELRDVFDDFGFFFGRECGEPFREALFSLMLVS